MTQWVSCCGHHFLTIWNHPIESKRGNLDDMTTPRPHFFKFKRIASDVFFLDIPATTFLGANETSSPTRVEIGRDSRDSVK